MDLLIVDDDLNLRKAFRRLLTSHGYRVTLAQHGLDALETLAPGRALPACIITDLVMPVMDGATLLAALRDDPRLAGIPVLVVSGSLDHLPTPPGVASLTKPADADELLAKLHSLIHTKREVFG